MRFHEALLCVLAVMLPLGVLLIWPLWWAPLLAFVVSLGLVWLVGWMVDHTYG